MKFDLVVVTAANAAQARGYRAQLKGRKGFLVVPDPGDRRVGSLGATVNVLRKIPNRGRVLVCHSGGDAKRTPAYAAMGKAFVPMADGRPMLDHIVEEMEKLPSAAGLTVCCGDVIPYLDATRVAFAADGVTGVAYPDGPEKARRHGVYEERKGRVVNFLQKPKVTKGKFLIDTGILHVDWKTAAKMKNLPVAGDIYEDFPKMLLAGFAPFAVSTAKRCTFFHIGSSAELLKLLGRDGRLVDGVEGNELELAGDNIVTNIPASFGKISLGKGECLTGLPLGKDEWYPLAYRITDTFKEDGLWEKHALSEKMRAVDHARLLDIRNRVTVELPLRIDLAGGWSDTPPICNELGGTVLNFAATLEGVKPVKVTVKRIPEKEVRVESRDLGKSGVLKTLAEIRAPKDPHDWCALVKSALTVTGFDFAGGGLDISISADVPKGSGMGTSSILGAAAVTAFERIAGRPSDRERVSELTLALEREMRTGGGWQDQVGGLLPGVKLIVSKPGAKQALKVRRASAASEKALAKFLDERALLYFTGRKRMARNILHGVVSFFHQNPDNLAHEIVRRLKADAVRAFDAIEAGDWESLAHAINGYWLSKKALDPGSTNPLVELIIARMAPWISAVSLCGAGGGGFMFAIARSKAAKEKMKSALTRNPPIRTGRFYDFRIAR